MVILSQKTNALISLLPRLRVVPTCKCVHAKMVFHWPKGQGTFREYTYYYIYIYTLSLISTRQKAQFVCKNWSTVLS